MQADESRLAIMPLSDMRGHQDPTATGVLRTKPGRTDAIPTLSMSCSDKIARWNVLGVQGSLLALFIEPIYLATVVVGDGYDHAPIERALNQRVANIDTTSLPAGFRVNQCAV
ncbi:tRNA-specific adenosine deaminase 1, partial [Coemansia biformis]